MKRHEVAHATALIEAASDLVKVRLGALIPQVIAQEFSRAQPSVVDGSDMETPRLQYPALQLVAESILSAARERATLHISKAVADKLANESALKAWRNGRAEREALVKRAFEEWARGIKERAEQRARIDRLRKGSVATSPATLCMRPGSHQRAAIRERLAELKLPSFN